MHHNKGGFTMRRHFQQPLPRLRPTTLFVTLAISALSTMDPAGLFVPYASAQTTPATIPPAASTTRPDTNATKADGKDAVEVITVTTARRRGEEIQEVPVAVSTLTAQSLQNQQITNLEDLNLSIPNVTIVRNTGTNVGAQVYIRGVGNDDSSFTLEPPVGMYLDGVYIGRQIGGMVDMLDFERVEFVRGPQGTLYGRNSSAGAISYTSRRPNTADSSFRGSLAGGTDNTRNINLSGNLSLEEGVFAIKLDYGSRKRDGWMRIVNASGAPTGQYANAINTEAARLSALWAISANTDLFVSADTSKNRSGPQAIASVNCTGLIGVGVSPFAPNSAFNVVCPFRFDARTTGNGAPDINSFRGSGFNATLTTSLGGVELKSITGYRRFKDDLALDLSGNPAAPFNLIQYLEQKQFSQELQVSSKSKGAFEWIAGIFYFDEDVDQNAVFGGRRNIDRQGAKSSAVFGEAYWKFMPSWTLTIGGRSSEDKKQISRRYFLTPTDVTPAAVLNPGVNDYRQRKFTPKLGVDFRLDKNVLLYATWGEGYRAGGYAAARPTSVAQLGGQVLAETVRSWELGMKSDLLQRKLRLNVAYFQSTYKNLQSSVLGADGSFNVISGDAHFSGVDIESAWKIMPGWNVYGIAGFLKDEWTRQPPGTPTAVRLKHVPRSQYKLGTDVRQPLGAGTLVMAANYRWTDEIYRSTANHQNIKSPSYGLVDAQVSYEWDGGKYRVALAGTNLADKVYWTQGVSTLGRYIGEPRLITISVGVNF
jgi:iron complex outermembrane recepter protein